MKFDYLGAKSDGYSDDEILGYLKTEVKNFDFDGAISDGYSVSEIADEVSRGPAVEPIEYGVRTPPRVIRDPNVAKPSRTDIGAPMEHFEETESIPPARFDPVTGYKAFGRDVDRVLRAVPQAVATEFGGKVQGIHEVMDLNQQEMYDLGKSVDAKKKLTSYETVARNFYRSREAAPKAEEFSHKIKGGLEKVAQVGKPEPIQPMTEEEDVLYKSGEVAVRSKDKSEVMKPARDFYNDRKKKEFVEDLRIGLEGKTSTTETEIEDARQWLLHIDAIKPQNLLKTLNAAGIVAAESGAMNISSMIPVVGVAVPGMLEKVGWIDEVGELGLDDDELVNSYGNLYGLVSGLIERGGGKILEGTIKATLKGKPLVGIGRAVLAKAVGKQATRTAIKKALSAVGNQFINAISEGAEEWSQAMVGEAFKYAALTEAAARYPEKAEQYLKARESVNLDPKDKLKLEAAYFGAISGGFTSTAGSTLAATTRRVTGKQSQATDDMPFDRGSAIPKITPQELAQLPDQKANLVVPAPVGKRLQEYDLTPQEFYQLPDDKRQEVFEALSETERDALLDYDAPEAESAIPDKPDKVTTKSLSALKSKSEVTQAIESMTEQEVNEISRRAKAGLPTIDLSVMTADETAEVADRTLFNLRKKGILPKKKTTPILLDDNAELETMGKQLESQVGSATYGGVTPGVSGGRHALVTPTMTFRDEISGSNIEISKEGGLQELKEKLRDKRKGHEDAEVMAIADEVGVKLHKKTMVSTGDSKNPTKNTYLFKTDDGISIAIANGDTVSDIKNQIEKRRADEKREEAVRYDATQGQKGEVTRKADREEGEVPKWVTDDVDDYLLEQETPETLDTYKVSTEDMKKADAFMDQLVRADEMEGKINLEKELYTAVKKQLFGKLDAKSFAHEADQSFVMENQRFFARSGGKGIDRARMDFLADNRGLLAQLGITDIESPSEFTEFIRDVATQGQMKSKEDELARLRREIDEYEPPMFAKRDYTQTDLFGDDKTGTQIESEGRKRAERAEIERRKTEQRGGEADMSGLPLFEDQNIKGSQQTLQFSRKPSKKPFSVTVEDIMAAPKTKERQEILNKAFGGLTDEMTDNIFLGDTDGVTAEQLAYADLARKFQADIEHAAQQEDEAEVRALYERAQRQFPAALRSAKKELGEIEGPTIKFATRRPMSRDGAQAYADKYGLTTEGVKDGQRVFRHTRTGTTFRANNEADIRKAISDIGNRVAPKMTEKAGEGIRFATRGKPDQAQTPEFKRWFGDWQNDPENASKVVDESGKPLVVYHGGMTDITSFERGPVRGENIGAGFFTDGPNISNQYAIFGEPTPAFDVEKVVNSKEIQKTPLGDNVAGRNTPVYLDIKKPIHDDDLASDVLGDDEYWLDRLPDKWQEAYDGGLYTKKEITEMVDNDEIPLEFRETLPTDAGFEDNNLMLQLSRILKADGKWANDIKGRYDGIVFKDKEVGGTTYIPFSPTQIKSATGNRGTFDPQNPDIRFAQKRGTDETTDDEGLSRTAQEQRDPLRIQNERDEAGTQTERKDRSGADSEREKGTDTRMPTKKSVQERAIVKAVYRHYGKNPNYEAIKFVEGEPYQQQVARIFEQLTGERVQLIELNQQQAYADGVTPFDGFRLGGTSYIDVSNDQARPLLMTMFHEWYHGLSKTDRAFIEDAAKLTEEGQGEFEMMQDEFFPDIAGEILSRPETLEYMAKKNPVKFRRIVKQLLDTIKSMIDRFKRLIVGEKNPVYTKYVKSAEEMRDRLVTVLEKRMGTDMGTEMAAAMRPAERQKVDPFFSPTLKAVQNLKQEKGTGDQMFAMISKTPGVKEAEWKWMGLDDFLKGKKSVTRQEVEAFVRENQVQVDLGIKDVGPLQSIPITPEMAASVLYEGQPMFASREHPQHRDDFRRIPETGSYPAIRTKDGELYVDTTRKQSTHVLFAKSIGLDPADIESGGWVADGIYEGSFRSDIGRWAEKELARRRVEERRGAASVKEEGIEHEGQPMFAKRKHPDPIKWRNLPDKDKVKTEDLFDNVLTAEERELALKSELKRLPKGSDVDRANIKAMITEANADKIDEIKTAIYNYASKLGMKGIHYNKVDMVLQNTKTVKGLDSAIEKLDQVFDRFRDTEAKKELEKLLTQQVRRLNAVKGTRVSTVDAEANNTLQEYINDLMSEPDAEAVKRTMSTLNYIQAYGSKEMTRDDVLLRDIPEKYKKEVVDWLEDPLKPTPDGLKRDLQKMFKPTLATMDAETARETIDDINEIMKSGRTRRKAELEAAAVDFKENVILIANGIGTKAKKPMALQIQDREKRGASFKHALIDPADKMLFANLRPERIFEWLDPNLKKQVFMPMVESENKKYENMETVDKDFVRIHKNIDVREAQTKKWKEIEIEYKAKDGALTKKRKSLTLDNGMFIYANSLNAVNRAHLIGTGYTDAQILDVTESLPEAAKKAVDDMVEYFDNVQWARLAEVFQREHNIRMPKEHKYFPIRNLSSERAAESQLMSDLLIRAGSSHASTKKGFTKGRVLSKTPFSRESYFETVYAHLRDSEQYVAYNDAVRNASKYLADPMIMNAIKDRSPHAYKALRTWIARSAYGKTLPGENFLDSAADFIRHNYVSSVLGGNLVTILKQPASYSQGLEAIGNKMYAMQSAVTFGADVSKWAARGFVGRPAIVDFVYSKSTMMRNRSKSIEREFVERLEKKGARAKLSPSALLKIREFAMGGIQAADLATTVQLWHAKYLDALNTHGNEMRARAEADENIRKTQPMGGLIHLPASFTGRPLERAFSMFMNQPNQNFNLLFETVSNWKKAGAKKSINKLKWYTIIPSVMIYMASHGGRPPWEDWEGWLDYLSDTMMGGVVFGNWFAKALTGNITNRIRTAQGKAKKRSWNDAITNPVLDVLNETGAAIRGQQSVSRMAQTAARLSGVPGIAQGMRTAKGVSTAIDRKDPRHLVWSKAALQGEFDEVAAALRATTGNPDALRRRKDWAMRKLDKWPEGKRRKFEEFQQKEAERKGKERHRKGIKNLPKELK